MNQKNKNEKIFKKYNRQNVKQAVLTDGRTDQHTDGRTDRHPSKQENICF